MQMDEFLEEAKTNFKKWHFKQTWKYTIAFDATYESIWYLERKYKEEGNTEEIVIKETSKEEVNNKFLCQIVMLLETRLFYLQTCRSRLGINETTYN